MTQTTSTDTARQQILDTIEDEGYGATDTLAGQFCLTDSVRIAALVDACVVAISEAKDIKHNPEMVLVHCDATVYTHSSADEVAREMWWSAEDAVTQFLQEVSAA